LVSAWDVDIDGPMLFLKFTERWNKRYGSEEEKDYRFSIFKQNLLEITKMNAIEGRRVFGITKFTDLSKEEFRSTHLTYKPSTDRSNVNIIPHKFSKDQAIPTSFDWRSKGAITPVKNQGDCGSCWAFSATEQIESIWFLNNGILPVLSPQQIVDCDNGDEGCFGGDTLTAYKYVIEQGGLDTAKSYPYVGCDEKCKFKESDVAAKVSDYSWITKDKNETTMQYFIANVAPISICVDAITWQFYIGDGEIIRMLCGEDLDHCVQITGYSVRESDNIPYWIIRNSWGVDWGNGGYVYVEMFCDLCGVANEPTTVVVPQS